MDIHISITGCAALLLLIYSCKWAMKGEIFHPAFVYSLINVGMYALFAFGPYIHNYNIKSSYYYIHIFFLCAFVAAITCGIKNGRQRTARDIKLTARQSSIIYWLSVILSLSVVLPLILSSNGSLEQAVNNRFDSLAEGQELVETNSTNPVMFFLINLSLSLRELATIVTVSYSVGRQYKYSRIVVLTFLMVLEGLFGNSRTAIVFGAGTLSVPIYIIYRERGLVDFKKLTNLLRNKLTMAILFVLLIIVGLLTNVRSSALNSDLDIPYEAIEKLTKAEKKPWFELVSGIVPPAVLNPFAQLSIYASSTIAIGGAVTKIALDDNLKTWGIRTLAPIYRVVDRFMLAPELVRDAQENLTKIWGMGGPDFFYGWWGASANYIVDFGLVGGGIISMIMGWLIGWIYGRIYTRSRDMLKAVGSTIILKAMILTPAVSPFSFFPSFINFMILIFLLLKPFKITRQTRGS